ncbi:Haem-NO-binding [Spirosomataceae bacterium TFI 002]|nr:Haem-NO-binding [Spirosomataceae bacterium TFI 002]
MKGIVFTEFLEMVEEKFDYEMVDDILTMQELPSEGIYSAVGTYSHTEMVTLVTNLHEKTDIPLPILLETFGEYLFGSLQRAYGGLFSEITSGIELLNSIEHHIHVQVKKLYPDAELPTFKVLEKSDQRIVMEYYSERKMGDLAVGLIKGCMKHFNENVTVEKEMLSEDGKSVKFTVTMV